MKQMIKFTDIGQFRNIIRDVITEAKYKGVEIPTLQFTGTIKTHGTNAGVSWSKEDGLWVQSRKNIIEVGKDNAGFAFYVESHKEVFDDYLKQVTPDGFIGTLFGEWAGGNIQKGVAINGLEKMFIVFALKFTEIEDPKNHRYVETFFKNEECNIFNTHMFDEFVIDIDFNFPEKSQNEIVKWVEEVEAECPVGKYFGVSGIGEGIVFTHYEDGVRKHIFKAKGQKHSSSKVKKIAEVDVEKVNSIMEFVDYAVTENRLNQAVEQVFKTTSTPIEMKGMGNLIKWVMNDILKEEMDTLVENGLEPGDIGKYIATKTRDWFIKNLTSL